MKNLMITLAILIVAMPSMAQHPNSTIPQKWRAVTEKSNALVSSNVAPINNQKTTGTTKERVKALFINFGKGDDSLFLTYNSLFRGSQYDYNRNTEYSGGYQYLNGLLFQAKVDSFNYITRNDHVSPYFNYFKEFAQYDTANNIIVDDKMVANSLGVYTNKKYRDLNEYNAQSKLLKNTNFQWDSISLQFDTTTQRNFDYTLSGNPNMNNSFKWVAPYPTKVGNQRSVFYYSGTGQLLKQNDYLWDSSHHNWATKFSVSTLHSYNAFGLEDTMTTYIDTAVNYPYIADTTKVINVYNANHQKTDIYNYLWDASTSQWAIQTHTTQTFPNATSDFTAYKTVGIDGSGALTVLLDSATRVLDAQNQVLSGFEYNDDGFGDVYNITVNNTYYAVGKVTLSKITYIDIVNLDTFSQNIKMTYNAMANPINRTLLNLDAYGNPTPDTILNLKDIYYYETYIEPTSNITTVNIKQADLVVSPNPVSQELHLQSNEIQNGILCITNGLGQIIRQHPVSLGKNEAIIDFSGFQNGIYFIEIIDAANNLKTKTQKIIKN